MYDKKVLSTSRQPTRVLMAVCPATVTIIMTDLNGGLVVELEELGAEGQEQTLYGVGDVLRCDEYPHTHRLKTAT